MRIIQSAAAVYVIICVAALAAVVLQAAWTNKPANYTFKGIPILLFAFSAVICAISTIGSLS